jgi:F0F1-type ATP synthase delta subunit
VKQPRSKIAQLVADKTLQKGSSKRFNRELAAYLLNERRVNELDSLLRDVQHDWADAGYVEILARSARPLSPAVKTDIKRRIKQLYPKAKRIVITEIHDPAVVGGAKLQLADRQLDISVAADLARLRQLTPERN